MSRTPEPRRGVSPETPLRELINRRRNPVARFFVERPAARTAVLLTLLILQTGFFAFLDVVSAVQPRGWPWLLVLGLEAFEILLIVWRNRFPLGVFLTILTIDCSLVFLTELLVPGENLTGTFAGLVAMYSVAKWKRPRTTWSLGALAVTLVVGTGMVMLPGRSVPRDFPALIIVTAILSVAVYVICIIIGLSVRRDRLHQMDLEAWAEAHNARAQLEERARIAREMHDVVAHSLTVMIALADGAKVVTRKNPERGSEVMSEVSTTGRAALADMRRVLGILKSSGEEEAPRSPLAAKEAVRELVEGFRRAGVPVVLTEEGRRLPSDPVLAQTVYRIVQESLTNVLRYARSASSVEVLISVDLRAVRVSVRDNGLSRQDASTGRRRPSVSGAASPPHAPGAAIPGTGNGLQGLITRAEAFGGTLTAGPGPQGGWAVEAVLPVDASRGGGKA